MNCNVYIVGAHSRGQTLKEYLSYLNPDLCIKAFLTDDLSENREEVDGIPVKDLNAALHKEYPVYLATRGIYHAALKEKLSALGFHQIIPVTVELDRKLRNEYVKRVYQGESKSFLMLNDLPVCKNNDMGLGGNNKKTACLYVANSIYDKPLQDHYQFIRGERIIQVGASLTEHRLSENVLSDCIGDNISDLNRQYCELTAMYWIWKHGTEDYIGLVHYRRHFLLQEDWVEQMDQNDIDVILPVPLFVGPSIADNYRGRHIASDWDFMMDYLRQNYPADYQKASVFFKQNLYSPCNMFIMKKEILHSLCNWLFPILHAVVQHGGEKDDSYLNRYPGFISERLITYYIESNRDKYKIAYADKNFLS